MCSYKKFIGNRDRGWGLLPVLVLITVLSLLGISVLRTMESNVVATGIQRRTESVLNIAEAGVAYGMEKLRGSPFNFEGPSPNANSVINTVAAPKIDDTACNSNSCPVYQWNELTPGAAISFGGGAFRVAVRDDLPGGGADTNNRILMRSFGTDSVGTQRLIEVVLELQ